MGSCPPSTPFSGTRVRAFWPFTPRPAVLPLPEPMPRPTRLDLCRAPGLSRISLSFIAELRPSAFHPQEVGDLPDHAADGGRVLQLPRAVHLVETEADQRLLLPRLAADGRADLRDLHGFPRVRHRAPPRPRSRPATPPLGHGAARAG